MRFMAGCSFSLCHSIPLGHTVQQMAAVTWRRVYRDQSGKEAHPCTVSVRIRDIRDYIILLASNLHRRMVLNVIALFQLNWIKWTILLLGMLRCWLCVASTCVSKKIIYVLFVFQLHSFLFLITYNIDITKWSTIVWSPVIVPITYIQCEFQRMHSWAIIMLTLLRLSLNVMSCYLALVFFYINRCMLLLQVYPVFQ